MIFRNQLFHRFSAFLLAIMLFSSALVFDNGQYFAVAAPFTPKIAIAEIDPLHSPSQANLQLKQKFQEAQADRRSGAANIKQTVEKAPEKAQNALKRAADNVREKLNLDEPLPQSTKDFLNDIKPSAQ